MSAHDRGGHLDGRSEVASTARAVPQELDDAAPRRVGQGRKEPVELVGHWDNS